MTHGSNTQISSRDILDHLMEGCQVISPEWRYLYVNDTLMRHARKERHELIGHTMWEAYPGIESTTMFSVLKECMRDRTFKKFLHEFTYPEGARAWFQLSVQPVPEGLLVMSLDVTEQVETREQLWVAQKMEAVGRLAGGVAHDFNNLLCVIGSYTDFVLEGVSSDDPIYGDLKEIRTASLRAEALTRQLLAFSRKQILQPEVLDLNALVAAVEKMLRRLIGEDVELVFAPGAGLWPMKVDPGQIEQVLMNLAVNARDAMPDGGRLTLSTSNVTVVEGDPGRHADMKSGSYVMLSVSDTGCGMDDATRARIFEPFFTTKGPGKGTGLGLAMVYGIVNQSGGSIEVQSTAGRGATFRIYLPREEAPVARKPSRAPHSHRAVGRETILVVEDEESVRSLARRILTAAGYTVLTACNGDEALRRCAQSGVEVSLLLTDVVMPGMNGRELAARLSPLCPLAQVLYMSGYTDDAIAHRGVLEPGSQFIGKPFSVEALTRKVRGVLDASRPSRHDALSG